MPTTKSTDMSRLSITISILFIFSILSAQDGAGLALGQHNGLSGAVVNPALSLQSDHSWEVQLGGGQAFLETNYAEIQSSNLTLLLKEFENVQLYNEKTPLRDKRITVQFNHGKQYFVDAHVSVLGPGILVSPTEHLNLGFKITGRSMISGYDIPSFLSGDFFEKSDISEELTINKFQLTAASWMEYAIHLGTQQKNGKGFGVNLKWLTGYHLGLFTNEHELDLQQLTPGILEDIYNGNMEFAMSDKGKSSPSGKGVAMDLGWTFASKKNPRKYIGISLVDLGWMHYDVRLHEAKLTKIPSISIKKYKHVHSVESLPHQLEKDGVRVDTASGFNIYLPTALSLQIARPLSEHISFEAFVMQRLKFKKRQLSRANKAVFSLVFENNNFAAFVPITFYHLTEPRVGLAFRLYYLTIGSDHIMSLFGQKEFTGSDVYFRVSVYPFTRTENHRHRGATRCYAF